MTIQIASTNVVLLILFVVGGAAVLPSDRIDVHQQMQQYWQNVQKLHHNRHLLQTTAESTAIATPGTSVTAVSNAESTGQPTSATVRAVGTSPGVVINCEQQARNGQQLSKECIEPRPTSTPATITAATPAATPALASTYEAAPRCTKDESAYELVLDTQDRPWGWENDVSCAFKDASNKPRAFDRSRARKQP